MEQASFWVPRIYLLLESIGACSVWLRECQRPLLLIGVYLWELRLDPGFSSCQASDLSYPQPLLSTLLYKLIMDIFPSLLLSKTSSWEFFFLLFHEKQYYILSTRTFMSSTIKKKYTLKEGRRKMYLCLGLSSQNTTDLMAQAREDLFLLLLGSGSLRSTCH